jgi:hypothetical protein
VAITRIQNRRGTASEWTSGNPTLARGEFGIEYDTGKFKLGNGTTAWSSLPYFQDANGIVATIVDGAPSTLNTLNEIAEALNDNADILDTLATKNSPTFTGTVDFTGATVSGLQSLPSQSGQVGKLLTTNGTAASWSNTLTVPDGSTGLAIRLAPGGSGAFSLQEWLNSDGETVAYVSAGGTVSAGGVSASQIVSSPLGRFDSIEGIPAEPSSTNSAKAVGFIGLPQVAVASGGLTLSTSHAGKQIYVTGASQTITIPANSSVPFEIGTTIVIINGGTGNNSIAITSNTLVQVGTGSTGTRTIAQHGMATLVKTEATKWYISGVGIS